MAKKTKKSRTFRLEMGWSGLLAYISGALAALIWVFVLGIWVGKRISIPKEGALAPPLELPLKSSETEKIEPERPPLTPIEPGPGPVEKASAKKVPAPEGGEKAKAEPRPLIATGTMSTNGTRSGSTGENMLPKPVLKSVVRPYFALQVASFRDRGYAFREVTRWRNRGFHAVVKRVDLGPKKGVWYRVCVGKYPSIEKAKKGAKGLARRFRQRSYIVPMR